MCLIRECNPGDFEQVRCLLEQLKTEKSSKRDLSQAVFCRSLASDTQFYFCAIKNDSLIGFGSFALKNNLWGEKCLGHVNVLIVDEKYRGQGIGAKLLERLVRVGLEKGCKRVDLDSPYDRKESHGFYKHCSFVERGLVFSKELKTS